MMVVTHMGTNERDGSEKKIIIERVKTKEMGFTNSWRFVDGFLGITRVSFTQHPASAEPSTK